MPNKIDIDGVEARIEKLCGDYEAAWHAVWAEETRSLVRTILRHRRAGNRDVAKAVRCLLPERLEWRKWTGTLTDRDRRLFGSCDPSVGDARLSGCTPRPLSRAGVLGGVTAGAAVLSCGV